MAHCRFCTPKFGSPQGVRAHLRHCSAYLTFKNGALPPPPAKKKSPLDPQQAHLVRLLHGARQNQGPIIREVAPAPTRQASPPKQTSKNMLESLRQLQEAQMEEERRQQVRRQQEDERHQRNLLQQRKSKKQNIIQQVKWLTIDMDLRWMDLPPQAKVDAKMSIEKELQPLPIWDYPFHEVQEIGEAVRERVYTPYVQTPSAQIPQVHKQEVYIMPISRLLSGLFECPRCQDEFDVDRTPEQEARCPSCQVTLERVEEEGSFDDA